MFGDFEGGGSDAFKHSPCRKIGPSLAELGRSQE